MALHFFRRGPIRRLHVVFQLAEAIAGAVAQDHDDALSKTGGNVTRAAKALGVSRATLQNKMKAYGLRASKLNE